MSDSEKLNLILAEMQGKKADMQGMKADMQGMKTDMQGMKTDMQDMKQQITNVQLHIENATDKNIQLLAENFVELIKKLNQAIPVADKNLAYEVKVNYLVEEMDKVKAELAELKAKIA